MAAGILYTYDVVSAGKATFAVTHLLMVMHLKGTMQYGDRGEVKLNKTPVSPSFCAHTKINFSIITPLIFATNFQSLSP